MIDTNFCNQQLDQFIDANEQFSSSSQEEEEEDDDDDDDEEEEEEEEEGEGDSGEDGLYLAPEVEADNLKVRLNETNFILKLALNNEFIKALEICSERADEELYASLANATLCFLRATLTFEQNDLQAALVAINQSFEVSSNKKRKTASLMMRFLYRPNYNNYTDEEIHAELVNAESMLLLALISFIADQSIICFVKGALRIRSCYQKYKECSYIMENKTNWSSLEAQKHFESGVRMGHGIFNVLMSYLPRRVLRFLEYVGFSGNRSIGIEELDKSILLNDGLRSVFSTLVILTYHSYIENLFGLGDYDLAKVEQYNLVLRQDYPRSAFYYLFLGRYYQMEGNLELAIKTFQDCILAQDDWKQFHSICHWEIMWCYAVQMNWLKAAQYSDLLRKNSKWSAASYTYQYGSFLYAQLVEDERNGLCERTSSEYKRRIDEIRLIMEQVPGLKIRYAGKTIPAEKFAITRSIKFCKQDNYLTLPALEFLYIWNVFATLKNSPQVVENLLNRIDSEMKHVDKGYLNVDSTTTAEQPNIATDDDDDADDQHLFCDDKMALLIILKGMCLKHLGRFPEAEKCFLRVFENELNILEDTFLIPHSIMELAILKLATKQYSASRNWIKKARNDYTGYLLETIVHFRLHAASRQIRLEQEGEEELTKSFDSQEEQVNGDRKIDNSSSQPPDGS